MRVSSLWILQNWVFLVSLSATDSTISLMSSSNWFKSKSSSSHRNGFSSVWYFSTWQINGDGDEGWGCLQFITNIDKVKSWWAPPCGKMCWPAAPAVSACTCRPSNWSDCSKQGKRLRQTLSWNPNDGLTYKWGGRRLQWGPWWRNSAHWDCYQRRQCSSRIQNARIGPSPEQELEIISWTLK